MAMFALAIAGGVLPPGARAGHPPTAFMFADRVANTSLRMPQSGPASVTDFPQTLADTGAFVSLATLTPQPGIIPFELNVPLWSDGAHKTRWFSLPGTNRIVFSRDGGGVAPIGTVWIKHFDLELTNGVAESARRLETRFLVRTEDGVYGVTYRWGGSLTNAMLVDAGVFIGIRESQSWRTLKRPEGRAPFAPHDSTWNFEMNPSREELLLAPLALPASRERGLIASRSDAPTVAVGFIPRLAAPDALRRGATPDSGAVFSIVAPRRRISWRIEPWLESHGYHHQVAPRLRNRAA